MVGKVDDSTAEKSLDAVEQPIDMPKQKNNVITLKSKVDSNVADVDQKQPNEAEEIFEIGDLLVSYLEQIGVEYVFGIPGGPIEPFYNALARSERRGGLRSIVARHETGAAFMADGYARNSGNLGVCCGTAGPGTTNLITGVASAFDNHSPMLVITAQTALQNFGHGATQESGDTGINTVAMFSHCTRYSSLVSHVDQFEQKLTSAMMTAFRSPKGPAHLSIPLDVLRSKSPVKSPSFDLSNLLWKPSPLDMSSVNILCKELSSSKNTVFIVGEECSNAIGDILNVAIKLNARIVTTPHAKGLVSPYHPLFKGVIGFAGHDSAIDVLNDKDVDVFIKIGTPIRETASSGWDLSVFNNRLIHVDSSEDNLMQSPMAYLHVRGDIAKVFENVVSFLGIEGGNDKQNNQKDDNQTCASKRENKNIPKNLKRHFQLIDESKCLSKSIPIKPQALMTALPKLFPPETKYLCDSGNSMAWSIHYLHPYDRRMSGKREEQHGGLFWTCLEFGSMGWAIGSSVGTAIANYGRPVVCLTGDGSMLMYGGDVTVAIQQKLPIIFVILNDSEYGMVRHGQSLGSAEIIGYQLPTIDFCAYAKSMGINTKLVNSLDDLSNLDINDMCTRAGPTILDVRIDKNEVPPMDNRLKALGTMNGNAR